MIKERKGKGEKKVEEKEEKGKKEKKKKIYIKKGGEHR